MDSAAAVWSDSAAIVAIVTTLSIVALLCFGLIEVVRFVWDLLFRERE